MEKLEKIKKQADYVEIIPLPDGKNLEMHFETNNQTDGPKTEAEINSLKVKEYFVRNQSGEIIKFADLNFNKELFEDIKNACMAKGIVLKNEEIERIAEKQVDAILANIDENKSTEN